MHVNPFQLQQAIRATHEEIGNEAFIISPVALMAMYEGAIEAITYAATEEEPDIEAILGLAINYANEVASENHICITCEFIDADGDVSEAQEIATAVIVNMINTASNEFCDACKVTLTSCENDEAA